jgi:hypothetical protein
MFITDLCMGIHQSLLDNGRIDEEGELSVILILLAL